MPDAHTDFVIQISGPARAPLALGAAPETTDGNQLTSELQRSLQPGGEIVLIIGTCMARTSILWLSALGQDSSFRAGVRLFSISARSNNDCQEYQKPRSEADEVQSATREAHLSF
jgi:hypothetical protein